MDIKFLKTKVVSVFLSTTGRQYLSLHGSLIKFIHVNKLFFIISGIFLDFRNFTRKKHLISLYFTFLPTVGPTFYYKHNWL